MERLSPAPAGVDRPGGSAPFDRAHWESVAEESLARVFEAAGAGLSLPGLDGRRPQDETREASDEGPGLRQRFRLGLSDRGTSFTPGIGVTFHFASLRQLTAASGRQLGLKAVIVVRGQVVLLPDAGPQGPWAGLLRRPDGSIVVSIQAAPDPERSRKRTLLGLAELVPLPPGSEGAATWDGLALRPLWSL